MCFLASAALMRTCGAVGAVGAGWAKARADRLAIHILTITVFMTFIFKSFGVLGLEAKASRFTEIAPA
jgi:hypothetical protein